jgi:hypothetical protein
VHGDEPDDEAVGRSVLAPAAWGVLADVDADECGVAVEVPGAELARGGCRQAVVDDSGVAEQITHCCGRGCVAGLDDAELAVDHAFARRDRCTAGVEELGDDAAFGQEPANGVFRVVLRWIGGIPIGFGENNYGSVGFGVEPGIVESARVGAVAQEQRGVVQDSAQARGEADRLIVGYTFEPAASVGVDAERIDHSATCRRCGVQADDPEVVDGVPTVSCCAPRPAARLIISLRQGPEPRAAGWPCWRGRAGAPARQGVRRLGRCAGRLPRVLRGGARAR